MERFSKSPSSEDFEIVRAVLGKLSFQGTPTEMQEQAINAVSELLPEYELDTEMIEALVRCVQLDAAV
jgi:hypothetical protein